MATSTTSPGPSGYSVRLMGASSRGPRSPLMDGEVCARGGRGTVSWAAAGGSCCAAAGAESASASSSAAARQR